MLVAGEEVWLEGEDGCNKWSLIDGRTSCYGTIGGKSRVVSLAVSSRDLKDVVWLVNHRRHYQSIVGI